MKEKIIEFETAKLAKEKKFEVGVRGSFIHYLDDRVNEQDGTSGPFGWKKDECTYDSSYFINNWKEIDFSNDAYKCYAAPTQSLLQKWLREEHNIHIIIPYTCGYTIVFNLLNKDGLCEYPNHRYYNTYEEALEIGLIEALKLI